MVCYDDEAYREESYRKTSLKNYVIRLKEINRMTDGQGEENSKKCVKQRSGST